MSATEIVLIVDRWSTSCGHCGYGRGGWAASPAREGKPPLTPRSTVCHGCGETFTHIDDPYSRDPPQPIVS